MDKIPKRMLKQFQLQKAQDLIAVELKPVNSTFSAKSLDLSPGSPSLKIGRQTSPKQPPTAQNGIFDSKVLSRQHAELWLNGDDGRVYIKDVGSSNGTFVNGERLSPEGLPSEARELRSGDRLEFGVDILTEDGSSVMFQRVSCAVEIQTVAQQMQHYQQQQQHPAQQSNTTPLKPAPTDGNGEVGLVSGKSGGPPLVDATPMPFPQQQQQQMEKANHMDQYQASPVPESKTVESLKPPSDWTSQPPVTVDVHETVPTSPGKPVLQESNVQEIVDGKQPKSPGKSLIHEVNAQPPGSLKSPGKSLIQEVHVPEVVGKQPKSPGKPLIQEVNAQPPVPESQSPGKQKSPKKSPKRSLDSPWMEQTQVDTNPTSLLKSPSSDQPPQSPKQKSPRKSIPNDTVVPQESDVGFIQPDVSTKPKSPRKPLLQEVPNHPIPAQDTSTKAKSPRKPLLQEVPTNNALVEIESSVEKDVEDAEVSLQPAGSADSLLIDTSVVKDYAQIASEQSDHLEKLSSDLSDIAQLLETKPPQAKPLSPTEKESLEREIALLKAKMKMDEEMSAKLMTELEQKDMQLARFSDYQQIQANLVTLTSTNQSLQKQLAESQQKIKEHSKSSDAVQSELSHLRADQQKLQKELSIMQATVAEKQKTITDLEKSLKEAQTTATKQPEQVSLEQQKQVNQQLETLTKQLLDKDKETSAYKSKYEQLELVHIAAVKECNELRQDLEGKKLISDQLAGIARQMESRIKDLEKQLQVAQLYKSSPTKPQQHQMTDTEDVKPVVSETGTNTAAADEQQPPALVVPPPKPVMIAAATVTSPLSINPRAEPKINLFQALLVVLISFGLSSLYFRN